MKYVYILAIVFGFGMLVYFYGFNFDNMSEEQLIDTVLYWYVPLTFGLYGIVAYLVRKTASNNQARAIQLMFSGKNVGLTVLSVFLLAYTGLVGFLVFIIPLSVIKLSSKMYDFLSALIGTTIWIGGLWAFFYFFWASL
ncbi:MAG: hypothetical protein C0596_00530 [Marinilabiliales bacterium]|nr:MAG: hypothetical protein C0596_00530 [Marinilabiliales bacterium]